MSGGQVDSPLQKAANEAGVEISPWVAKAWNHRGPALQFYIQALLASSKISQAEYNFLVGQNATNAAPPPPPDMMSTPPAPLSAPPSYDGLQTPPMGGAGPRATRKRATSLCNEQDLSDDEEAADKAMTTEQQPPKHKALTQVLEEKVPAPQNSSPRAVHELM
jgi:hypothetical protein